MGTHDEPLSLAVGVNDPNCAPIIVEGGDPAHAKSGFNDFIYDLPILH